MNSFSKFFFLIVITLMTACEEPSVDNGGNTPDHTYEPDTKPSEEPANTNIDTSGSAASDNSISAIPEQKDCEVSDKHYDKNIFAIKDVAQMVCIVANASTKDKELGESHRVLEILNTSDCSKVLEKTLPVNRSPDFPYYLIPQTYEAKNQIVAIQGYSSTYYYDVKNKALVGPIVPQFLVNHEAVDAQSGMVSGFTVWGHYLLGHAVDFGNFAFDISDIKNPKPVLPVAEYPIPKTGEFNNLFVLEDVNGRYQALIPTTDIDAGGTLFELGKMFRQPLKINNTIAKNVQNNRFIVFNDRTEPGKSKKAVVDMFSKKSIDLPANLVSQPTGEILKWLNSNQ